MDIFNRNIIDLILSGRKFYDIDVQSAVAFREIKKGLEDIGSFCCSMNMQPLLAKRKNDLNYDEWKNSNNFHINHVKSSGAMEAAGAVTIFQKSIDKNKLRSVSYSGDGDTSSFNEVRKSKPYGYFGVVIKECVGHIQKR